MVALNPKNTDLRLPILSTTDTIPNRFRAMDPCIIVYSGNRSFGCTSFVVETPSGTRFAIAFTDCRDQDLEYRQTTR